MDIETASRALACLGHEQRLRLFRLLIRQGAEGMAAGEMAKLTTLPPSTLSFHLRQMEEAGLVFSWRVRRSIRYAADVWATRMLLVFLVEECCGSDPQLCGDLAEIAQGRPSNEGPSGMSDDKVFNVLFLCTGNSARSILAECVLNRLGQGRFKAHSAGSHPTGAVNPYALELLKNQNYPTGDLRSKNWEEFAAPGAPALDFVFTVCDSAAGEVCPVWPGQPMTAHWGLPDPAACTGSEAEKRVAFADTLRMLHNRISIFVNLPLRSLDRLSLQSRLDAIGQATGEGGA